MITYLVKVLKNYFSSYTGLSSLAWHGIFLSFVEAIFVGVYYFLPLYFIKELNFDVLSASFLISLYGIGTIIGGYFGGKLSDKYSSGKVCVASLVLQTIIFFLLTKLTAKHLLAVNLVLMGICSYAFITSSNLLILESCEFDQNIKLKALNILNVAANLGLAISAVVIGCLATYGFQIVFTLGSVSLLLLAIYCFLLISSISNQQSKLSNPAKSEVENKKTAKHPPNKIIYIVLICTFSMGFIIFQCNTTYSIYIQNVFPQFGLRALSILFALNSLLVVFLQTPLLNYFGKYNKILIMGVGTFLLGFGMFALTFSKAFYIAILSCIIYTLGEMLFFSVAQLICYESCHDKKGTMMGLYRTVYASSRVAAPVLGGMIFQKLGGNILWCFCGVIGIFCFILCHTYRQWFSKEIY